MCTGMDCLLRELLLPLQGRMPGPPQSLTDLWSTCTAMRTAVVGLLQPGGAPMQVLCVFLQVHRYDGTANIMGQPQALQALT